MKQFFVDILHANDPEKSGTDRFSLARVCLFISFLAYMLSGVGYVILSLFDQFNTSPEFFTTVMENLQYPLTLFAGYVFGGKALKTTQQIMNQQNKNNEPTA